MLRRVWPLLNISKEKVYELRIYDVLPNKYDKFYRMTSELLPLRASVSTCQAYWIVQLGGVNQVVHLWEYDSLKHRYDIRTALDSDGEWKNRYTIARQECLSSQTNMLLRMIYRESNASILSFKYMMKITREKELLLKTPGASLAASYRVVTGEHEGMYLHIVKGKELDDLLEVEPLPGSISKIMGPARWSSLIGCLWR
ncbi:putative protein NipSnap 3A-like [Trypanosoma rangeli]|uniref:NIPSNAP domain-containing protein n=1 Tax=Trypanosoma rangeli TaxID=5698 RepID=A0A422NA85_TRYRA|nr:putative protein NipSnap 3A-like [Trypanosoma rangeli]RNF02363.1 putative protein NipSnap 3A-like [Trypanosoma rangeli]|eukprot:RNF02363.1 putative protein NipSnap 3A-like [Trypanosoma rangeli]